MLRCRQLSVLDLLHGVPAALVLEVDVGLVLEQRLQELQVSRILREHSHMKTPNPQIKSDEL